MMIAIHWTTALIVAGWRHFILRDGTLRRMSPF
jgi:cytochrome b561